MLFLDNLYSCEESPEPAQPESIVQVPEILKGEWLDDWSFTNEFEFNNQLFNPATGRWFEGADDPRTLNPRPELDLKINPDGSFVWISLSEAKEIESQT